MDNAPPPPANLGRLPVLDEDALTPSQRSVLELVAAGRGRIPTPYRLWINSPELASRLLPLGTFLSHGTSLAKREAELAILTAARHIQAAYVFAAHGREAKEAGLDDATIEAISSGDEPATASPREAAVAAIARSLLVDPAVPQDRFEHAVETLGHAAIAELIMLIGYFTAVGLAMKMYAVEPPAA